MTLYTDISSQTWPTPHSTDGQTGTWNASLWLQNDEMLWHRSPCYLAELHRPADAPWYHGAGDGLAYNSDIDTAEMEMLDELELSTLPESATSAYDQIR